MTPPRAHAAQPDASIAEILQRALAQAGHDARLSGDFVMLPSGLRLQAALLETHPLEDGRVVAATRIVAFHDAFFPEGLPEVQPAAGADAAQAVAEGLAAWARAAAGVLEEAVRPAVRECALLAVQFPARGAKEARVYQAILGPILRREDMHLGGSSGKIREDDELCPACMTSRIQDALRDRLRADGCTGIGFIAGRDAAGRLIAECRVNGERFPEGVERLMAYAQSWPQRGAELRQQYVVIRPDQGRENRRKPGGAV